MEDEWRLTIANVHTEVEEQDQLLADVQQQLEEIQEDLVAIGPGITEDDQVILENDDYVPNNEAGMILCFLKRT